MCPIVIPTATSSGEAIGLDHIGIVVTDLDRVAQMFIDLGFHVTPYAAHGSGRTGNRCVMLRDGGYLELMATAPGQSSATLDRFLAIGPGAHILALEVSDELAACDRLRRAGIAVDEPTVTTRAAESGTARLALLMPADGPEGRVLLIRQLTRDLLWRPDDTVHPNHAVALTEAVYATPTPAATMTRLSRLSGRPAQPDPLGGFRIPLARGTVRILPPSAATALFPGAREAPPLIGLTLSTGRHTPTDHIVHAGGVAIRFTTPPA
jgi:Glyoxalase-like domain